NPKKVYFDNEDALEIHSPHFFILKMPLWRLIKARDFAITKVAASDPQSNKLIAVECKFGLRIERKECPVMATVLLDPELYWSIAEGKANVNRPGGWVEKITFQNEVAIVGTANLPLIKKVQFLNETEYNQRK